MMLTYEMLTKEQKDLLLASTPPITSTVVTLVRAGIYERIDMRGLEECWPYLGHIDKDGYGKFWVRKYNQLWPAHRYVWHIFHPGQPIADLVLHWCNNPACCNPAHLRDGSQSTNIQYMYDCDRGFRGEDHHLAKLTEVGVRAIRKDNRILSDIARDYDVSSYAIWAVKKGLTWKHVK
jgi:hypothetical protein